MRKILPYLKIFSRLRGRAIWTIRNTKIQTRLICLFLLLSLLPMLITGFFSYQQSSAAIGHKIYTYSIQVVNQVVRNVKVELMRLENDTIDVGFSQIVQTTLSNYGKISEWEVFNAQETIRETLVKKFSSLHDVSDVLLFTRKKEIIYGYGDKGFKLNLKSDFRDELLREIQAKNGVPVWKVSGPGDEIHLVSRVIDAENGIIVGRAIKSLYEGEYIGAVVIRTYERFFSDIYQEIDLGEGAEVFIIDSQGAVVSSRTPAIPIKGRYLDGPLMAGIQANHQQGKNVFNLQIEEKPYMVAFSPIEDPGWYVVTTIPYSYLNIESGRIRTRIMFLGIGCFLLAVLLSVLFTKSISKPLNKLIQAINEVKKGNLSVHIVDPHTDEIAEVTQNFNTMVKEIQHLLDDIKNTEAQKREAELKALQAQINPHFLSNILNTAKILANAQKAENLESLLTSLIQLLQLSMGKEEEWITVRKEIEYLQNYLNLQEFRYFNKFQVHFEIEPEIMDQKLPKFLLQPILENSVIHGIGPKKGPGVIEVKGFAYDGKMTFTVSDDGIGMSPETVEKIIRGENGDSRNHFCGIGIKNVHERIQLYFGIDYGLRIDSYPNQFTRVELTLPMNKQD
jgi:two-component system sensor histidine kinase YesM